MAATAPSLALPPVVAVLRARSAARLPEICEVLYAEGVRAFEFTHTTPDALQGLCEARERLPGDAVLGAGTVLTTEHVRDSADAGAQFLVSPVCLGEVLDQALELGVPFVPGTVSPTDAYVAWAAGAAMVKIWPCGPLGGAAFVKQVTSVLPEIPLMPSGGISVEEVADYLAAGAVAVGLGGGFQGDAAEEGGDLEALAGRARRAVASAAAS